LNKRLSNIAVGVLLAAIFFGVAGCKEPVISDSSLLTGDDELLLGTSDTISVNSYLLRENPIRSSAVGGGIVGSSSDPVAGTTRGSFYANFRTTTNNINFGDNLQLDSVVLVLKYRAKYGKFTQPVGISVYELSESISTNEYFTNANFGVQVPPVGQSSNFVPSTTDSAYVYGLTYAPQMRIRLSNDFGNKLLLADTANLANPTAFLNYMKGLYITTQTGSGGNGFVALDLYSGQTGILLYYRNSANDSLVYNFPISSSGQTVNRFEHSFTASLAENVLNNNSSEVDTILPVLSAGGTKAKLTFPHLDSLPKNIAINKAEIILPLSTVYSQYDSIFTPPSKINLARLDNSGTEVNDTEFANGNLETVTINGETVKRYRINITLYLQKFLNGTYPNNALIIKTPDANGERLVLSNATNKSHKIALKIIYTKL
jgi:hypothetical protein